MARHIYVHNPFCARKCPYCDFYSVTKTSLCEAFYHAAVREAGILGGVISKTDGTVLEFFHKAEKRCIIIATKSSPVNPFLKKSLLSRFGDI